MTTVGTIVDRALNTYLLGTYRTRLNALNGAMSDSVTDLVTRYAFDQIGYGSLIAIDNELMFVVELNAGANTLTVIRGVRGTAAATHADGAAIEINPRYPRFLIREAMQATAEGWPESLYWTQPLSQDLPSNGHALRIDTDAELAPATIVRVVRLLRQDTMQADHWHRVTNWRAEHDVEAADSISVFFEHGRNLSLTYRVVVGCRFITSPFTDLTDLQSDCHIPAGLQEALELGAAWRLLTGKETIRLQSEAEGESRKADEVTAGANARFAAQLLTLHDRRVEAEATRLAYKWGLQEQSF